MYLFKNITIGDAAITAGTLKTRPMTQRLDLHLFTGPEILFDSFLSACTSTLILLLALTNR
jgi:hypothetical protein